MEYQKQRIKWIGAFFLISFLSVFAGSACAYNNLIYDRVISGYGACSWQDNGDGTSLLKLTINFLEGAGHTGNQPGSRGKFASRGILLYTYDKNGNMNPSSGAAKSVKMNTAEPMAVWLGGWGFKMYWGGLPTNVAGSHWMREEAFNANMEILIDNQVVSDWPALSVQAANGTYGDAVGEITGGAYLDRFGTVSNCTVVDPVLPPPPPIGINMIAPDWNLGELPEGDADKVLSTSADQLCFTYAGAAVSGKAFVINASSANGVVGNRYRLKNVNDASQLVPYSVTLNSGTSSVSLPNVTNTALSLDSSGKTCFVPTFKTTVDPKLKEGDYSDVLTFTVVTKS
ncbi:hypothetical protein DIE18_32280 [Burkholderia sp. Bp9125]|nr:hypothetical protein DIE18_32280 [Burkholderia sp. Bp9125]